MFPKFFFTVILTTLFCSSALSQDAQDHPATAVTVAPSGVQRFSPGGWSSLSVVGVNPTDSDSQEVVSVYLGDKPGFQFSKRFWLPAHSKRQTWLPFLVPPETPSEDQQINVSMMRLDESGGGEVFAENLHGMPIIQRSLMLTSNEINTGLILQPPNLDGSGTSEATRKSVYETIYAGRDSVIQSSLDLSLVSFGSNFLPPTPGALDELDQLVIASDHLLGDTSGMVQVRQWLRSGGRLWIMLDLTSEALVTELIGDDARYSVVNRVELNDFQFDSSDTDSAGGSGESWSSELPVEMVRVFADVDEVAFRIDSWPAAFWQSVGQGEVLFTTLGARGWLQENKTPSLAFYQLSQRYFEQRDEPIPHVQAMTPILDDQIGYQIPSRRVAGTVLGINALVILVAGIWWARRRRLERLAILIPASAIAATAILLAIGNRHTDSVPSTVATGQIVRVLDATDEAEVSTVRAVYSQNAGSLELVSAPGTLTMPSETDATSETRRILWDDDGTSQWLGPAQPPGVVRHLESDSTLQLSHPITVRGTFDGDGFRGTVVGIDARKCEDGVFVAPPRPATSVTLSESGESSGQLRGGTENLLAAEQFIPGALLSDEQRMRQDFLRRVLASPEQNPFGSRPSLLLWTEPVELGVRFSDRFHRSGSAVVSIPIQIDRPAPGADFQIPATFIGIEAFVGSRGASSVFNPRTGKWFTQLTKPNETELLCRFPESLSPMTLKSVTLTLKINAPSRSLVIKAMVDGQPTTVYQQMNPTGLIHVTIDRGDALQWHADGGLWLAIEITETQQAAAHRDDQQEETGTADRVVDNTTWQIEFVHADAVGRIESQQLSSDAETAKAGKP